MLFGDAKDRVDDIAEGPAADFSRLAGAALGREPFVSPIRDFYQTNAIARSSRTMAEASALAANRIKAAQGQFQVAAE